MPWSSERTIVRSWRPPMTYTDFPATNGKQSIIGMFSKIHARRFPAAHPQLCVYVVLTEGHGETEFTIRIVDTNEERPPIVEGKGFVDKLKDAIGG